MGMAWYESAPLTSDNNELKLGQTAEVTFNLPYICQIPNWGPTSNRETNRRTLMILEFAFEKEGKMFKMYDDNKGMIWCFTWLLLSSCPFALIDNFYFHLAHHYHYQCNI